MPPKVSAAEAEVLPFALEGTPLSPPPELSEEEAGYWRGLVDPFPAERFQVDAVPTLIELCRAMGRSRKLAEQLDEMRHKRLLGVSSEHVKTRQMFIQLARQAREEAKLIAVLSQKLRLTDQSKHEKRSAQAQRERMAIGPRPWD
jgi:hypothetical protein